MKYIASWSGGKDSTAMVDLLLRDKKPLDYIVFCDTNMEFDLMYDYISKIKKYWEDRYNAKIIIIKSNKNYLKNYILKPITKGDNKGKLKGFLSPTDKFCEWRRDLKINQFEKWIKQNSIKEHLVYIGFTREEFKRIDRNKNQLYPLYDDYKMTENDCKQYLVNNEMENPLYRFFNRTGCVFCPYQSERDWYFVYKNFNKDWQLLKKMEKELLSQKKETINQFAFVNNKNTNNMEFKFENTANPLFLNDEPIKDCLCKI